MAHDHSGHHMDNHGVTEPPVAEHSPSAHAMHGMVMYFHGGVMETILFSFWKTDSTWGLVGSCIGFFIFSMLYEGLKVFRESLLQKALLSSTATIAMNPNSHAVSVDPGSTGTVSSTTGSTAALIQPCLRFFFSCCLVPVFRPILRPLRVILCCSCFRLGVFSPLHSIQTLLHILQVTMSYVLMLTVMTFNAWLFLAVVLGSGCGYFVFCWRKRVVIPELVADHCT